MPAYITSPTTGAPTVIDSVDGVYNLALQYARIAIGGANIKSRYSEFDKDMVQYGAIIADYKIRHVTSTEVNPNNNNFGGPKYAQVEKLYFADWNDREYGVEIKDAEAYAVVDGNTSFEVFVAQIINAINEGERLEANANYEKIFYSNDTTKPALIVMKDDGGIFMRDGSILNNLGQLEFFDNTETEKTNDEIDEDVYKWIIRTVKDMTQADLGSNSGGFVSSANLEDIRIIAPYDWLTDTNVTFLSRVFNLEKTDVLARIVETPALVEPYPEASSTAYGIIVCHKNALGRVVRYRSDMSEFVRQRWSRWFGREVVDMYYFNKYEKCMGLVFTKANV